MVSRLIAIGALLATLAQSGDEGVAGLLHLQSLDQRVTSTGYRLAVAAAALCANPVPLTGIELHDLSLYGGADRDEARRAFGLDGAPQLLAVAADSPAARAGLERGDALLAVGGVPVPPAGRGDASFDRIEALDGALDRDARDGTLGLTVRHHGTLRTLAVPLASGCASRFLVRVSNETSADADGRYVEISSGYVERAGSDAALAIVLAHELAHNILGHRARLEAAGVRYGIAQHFGRNARMIRETEIEADRLSVDLVARAGFDVDEAIAFREREWRGLAQALHSPTHPAPGDRLAVLRAELARIRPAPAAGS